jgi:phosphatidate phosphatase APP1
MSHIDDKGHFRSKADRNRAVDIYFLSNAPINTYILLISILLISNRYARL